MTLIVPVTLAALIAGAAPSFDTVYLANGGRVRGTVVEEDPVRGVTIQVPGGEVRKLAPSEISRVEYGDGAAGRPSAPAAPAAEAPAAQAPAGAPAQPEAAAPPTEPGPLPPVEPGPPGPAQAAPPTPAPYPPYPPPYPPPPAYPVRQPGELRALTLAARVGAAVPGGSAESGVDLKDFTGTLATIGVEGALRLTPRFQLGAYLDVGFGDPGDALQATCRANGFSCTIADARLGVMGRFVFTPFERQTAWLGIGLGAESISAVPDDTRFDPWSYTGFEPRLEAGFDFRGMGEIGVGLFLAVSSSTYTDVDYGTGSSVSIPSSFQETHTWVQVGLRGILFP